MSRFRKKPLYGNCLITAPDGQALCRTGMKKINWYLHRNLGEIVSNEPVTLRLFFEPSGRKGSEHPYNTSFKENRCVSCGGGDKITRHHVVPYCFRKHFPEHMKRHQLHDILPLCVPCHDKYELVATEFKNKIAKELNIPICGTGVVSEKSYYPIMAAAKALLNQKHKLPESRREELFNKIKEFYQREITQEDIVSASLLKPFSYEMYKTFGQIVVEKLENIRDFIFKWRAHFIENMNPQYLPEYWSIHNDV